MQIVRTAVVFLFAAALGAQTFRGNITGVVTDSFRRRHRRRRGQA